jgi:long-subunit fatty acid transport protein
MSLKFLPGLSFSASLLLPPIVHGAYPLITEDTGTQGAGNWQLELTAESDIDRDAGVTERTTDLAAVLSWGATDNLDVILGLPYQRVTVEQDGSRDTESSGGDIAMGLKWRFYEKDLLSFALRPAVTLPTGDEKSGLGAGKSTYSLYLVTTYAPEPWEFDMHFGYMDYPNELGEREDRWHVSVAGGYTFSNRLRLVTDLGTDTNPDPAVDERPVFLIVGAIYPVNKEFELSVGYKQGLTGPETDSKLLAGVTLRF